MTTVGGFEAMRVIEGLIGARAALDTLQDEATKAYVRAGEIRHYRDGMSPEEIKSWRALYVAIGKWRDKLFDEEMDAELRALVRLASERIDG